MGPNIKCVPGAYWDFFDHYVALTELSLQEALELAGFRSERIVDRFLPYTMVNAPDTSSVPSYLCKPAVCVAFFRQAVSGASPSGNKPARQAQSFAPSRLLGEHDNPGELRRRPAALCSLVRDCQN